MVKRPNILIFMTDQEQAGIVAPDHPCLTPHAERLAREGLSFTRTYCPTAHCCPSRATFFTGLYPSRHGIFNNISTPTALSRELAPGVTLFSDGLRSAGYDLAFTGKWHVSDTENPSDHGWRELRVTAGKGSFMHVSPAKWHDIAARDKAAAEGATRAPGRAA
jgi:arylsulfatase A-like enzyme